MNRFCNYVYMDKCEKVEKQKGKGGVGMEVMVTGNRTSDRSGEGTGEEREKIE